MTMRAHGTIDSARGLVPFGHVGWAYRDRAEFRARAGEYLADGVAQGQLGMFVGPGSAESLRSELGELAGLSGSQGICVLPVDEFYATPSVDGVVVPEMALDKHVAALQEAVGAGYTGLRAAIDVTALVRTAEQREALARFEYLADQKMAVHPVSALCAYDAAELGDAAAELVCLHPYVSPGSTIFQLYAAPECDFALSGQVDRSCDALLGTALRRTGDLVTGARVLIDARGLEFIDHRWLLRLADYAAARGATAVLRGAPRVVPRILRLLAVPNVRVEQEP
jgi:hypothetical protein